MIRFITVFFIVLPAISMAQLQKDDTSNDFYTKMNNTLNFRLDLDNDLRTFEFQDENGTYSIKPNTNLRLALALNYRFISLKVGYSPDFLAGSDSELKGNTKVFKLSLDIFYRDLMQNFDYNRVKGYYVEDFEDRNLNMIQNSNKYTILPDLKTLSITGTTWYRFNENYSFKAVANQNEIQTRSTGSFIPSLYYGYFEISDQTTLQDTKSFFALANAGYYHTFVINKQLFSNMGLSVGLGAEFNKLITRSMDQPEAVISYHNSMAANISFQIGLGYNSTRFYGGTVLNGNATRRNEQSVIKFDSVRGYFKIYVGYRFDAPKSLEKGMNWIEGKNPFK